MKKVLFVSNVLSHIYAFHLPYLKYFYDKGWKVYIMTNAGDEYDGKLPPCCDGLHNIKIARSPFNIMNICALKKAKKIIEAEKYDIVHCHTPMGGVIGRLASKKIRKSGSRVLYTAHGFHFYKGAPAINWMLYFTMEKYLSNMTDCIITINKEDFHRAQKHFGSIRTNIEYISGIGVNVDQFKPASIEEKALLKQQAGYAGHFLLIYAAEFIPRKNHRFFIENIRGLIDTCPDVKVLFAGKGKLSEQMKQLAKQNNVSEYIDFLGFRKDLPVLLKMCDIIISASIEEGFGINVVEGMSAGLPAVASVVRGHKEMVSDGINGYLFGVNDPADFCRKIRFFYENKERYASFSAAARETAERFSIADSLIQMSRIYEKYECELLEEICINH